MKSAGWLLCDQACFFNLGCTGAFDDRFVCKPEEQAKWSLVQVSPEENARPVDLSLADSLFACDI